MTDLMTLAELRVASQREIADDSEYAAWVMETASDIVRDAASQPGWDRSSAPKRARRIALRMAVSAIKHPDAEYRYNVGPLGGAYLEEEVIGLRLTEVDIEYLEAQAPGGSAGNGLWVASITQDDPLPKPVVLPVAGGGTVLYATAGDAGAFGDEVGD